MVQLKKEKKNYEYDVLNSENNLVKSVKASNITRSLNDTKLQAFKRGDQVVNTSKNESINKQVRKNF